MNDKQYSTLCWDIYDPDKELEDNIVAVLKKLPETGTLEAEEGYPAVHVLMRQIHKAYIRAKHLYNMDQAVRMINDEEYMFEEWLEYGVPDSSLTGKERLKEIAQLFYTEDSSYFEVCRLFAKRIAALIVNSKPDKDGWIKEFWKSNEQE